jgi:hypothetical protein
MGMGYTSSSDPTFLVPAIISEERYPVTSNYKVTLTSLVPGFGSENFYTSDLQSLIREKRIHFYSLFPRNVEAICSELQAATEHGTLDSYRFVLPMQPQRTWLGFRYTSASDSPCVTLAKARKHGKGVVLSSIHMGFGSIPYRIPALAQLIAEGTVECLHNTDPRTWLN